MTFVSLSLLVFLLHRSIKSSSAQYKTLRAELLEQFASSSDNSDVEELTWEDINKSRPFIAAFCMQYTPAEYQHEEKVRSAHASDGRASSAREGDHATNRDGALLPLTHTLHALAGRLA